MKNILLLVLVMPALPALAQNWTTTGNAGTTPGTNFIGTTDVQPLVFKVANNETMRFNTDRSVTFQAGAAQTSTKFSNDNSFGNWFNINNNGTFPTSFTGIRLTLNETIKTQIFHNDGAFSLGGSFDVLSGNAEMLSRTGDVYLSTGTFRANGIIVKNTTGNVGIGTTTPQSKLAVNGDVFAKKVKVTQTGWPDYVFYPQYKLPTLKETEEFIRKNKHLPDMPSASEIEKNGLDLGDNQAALLKKIEELTLHMIGLNKRMDTLSEENDSMKKELEEIKRNK